MVWARRVAACCDRLASRSTATQAVAADPRVRSPRRTKYRTTRITPPSTIEPTRLPSAERRMNRRTSAAMPSIRSSYSCDHRPNRYGASRKARTSAADWRSFVIRSRWKRARSLGVLPKLKEYISSLLDLPASHSGRLARRVIGTSHGFTTARPTASPTHPTRAPRSSGTAIAIGQRALGSVARAFQPVVERWRVELSQRHLAGQSQHDLVAVPDGPLGQQAMQARPAAPAKETAPATPIAAATSHQIWADTLEPVSFGDQFVQQDVADQHQSGHPETRDREQADDGQERRTISRRHDGDGAQQGRPRARLAATLPSSRPVIECPDGVHRHPGHRFENPMRRSSRPWRSWARQPPGA